MQSIQIQDIIHASRVLNPVITTTPLQYNELLSQMYDCNVYLKREDLQVVRSFKIRGAYLAIQSLSKEVRERGVVCASAGNHAQGVAYSCNRLGIQGKIFMPSTTPKQKISQVKLFGKEYVEVIMTGDTYDDAYTTAIQYSNEKEMAFIHPFDDPLTVIGQGTIGMEIMNQTSENIDHVFVTIGGGGLAAGTGSYIKSVSPDTKIIGVEPEGAPAMKQSIEQDQIVTLEKIDKFVDGAAVQKVGKITFELCKQLVDDIVLIPEGKACTTILQMYNNNAIVIEPAGALPITALDLYKDEIKGKNVVCVISGGNNDIDRMQDIKERSLIYEGLRHYFIINFPQRSGALREFLDDVLGKDDDIIQFEYTKKNNRENGPALVGIELKHREDYDALIQRLSERDFKYIEINKDEKLFNLLI
ncbi:threonine ammonia-lyase IlvA [Chengkuizengella sediminis]|uniref:threonine ammonia-lyase IlvA n=1 Tax=Chengkuizengella sediminis TaxID=1885917 RepID=UPI00138A24CA|nr:threonine ammonia-lyase IlvA [Chengkuizengella sediminis]NDI34850.1 threonine ammonia-lyase IlvA [Chengkuizengella sediminis]